MSLIDDRQLHLIAANVAIFVDTTSRATCAAAAALEAPRRGQREPRERIPAQEGCGQAG